MEKIKRHVLSEEWRGYITIANVVLLLGLIVSMARWVQSTEDQIKELNEHTIDANLHMPLQEKIKLFMPRNEIDGKFDAVLRQLDRIEKKLDQH